MKTPKWLQGRNGEIEELAERLDVPPIAVMPPPSMVAPSLDDDVKRNVITEAHNIYEEMKRERAADKAAIQKLQGEMAELILMIESEKRKCAAIEVDLAAALNDRQTLASQIQDYMRFMSLVRQCLDKWDIKAPAKPQRRPKTKPTIEKVAAHG